MAETDRPVVTIQMLSQPRYLCAVRAALDQIARDLGFEDPLRVRLVLAVGEAMTNIIRHGYHDREDGLITLGIRLIDSEGRNGLAMVLEDECPNVDLDAIRPPAQTALKPGGLGLRIIYDVMDDVRLEHLPGRRGVRMTLTKFVPACRSRQPAED